MQPHSFLFENNRPRAGGFYKIAAASITGDATISPAREPTTSIARFAIQFNVLVSGTYRILMTGSPIKSSVYGLLGTTLL